MDEESGCDRISGIMVRLHNSDFTPLEFEGVKKQAGANAFTMSPKKWIEATNAIGIVSKSGRYGGTYANEADMLNVVLFGKTAKQWKDENPMEKGNMRDTATLKPVIGTGKFGN